MDKQYPDISDILAQKARGKQQRASISFGEKLDILDQLRDRVSPIVEAKLARSHSANNSARSDGNTAN